MPDVVCPSCGQIYVETTEHFDPDKICNSMMLKTKEPWASLGWTRFVPDPGLTFDALACPNCESRLVDLRGHVKLADPVFVCETCGKKFKAAIALAGHKRSHDGKSVEPKQSAA